MRKLYVFFIFVFLADMVIGQSYTTVGIISSEGGNCYRMTSPTENSTAVWENNDLDLTSFQDGTTDLVWEGELYFGHQDDGGHGIAFVIQSEGPSAQGKEGAPIGYGGNTSTSSGGVITVSTGGIIQSIAIEFDTYANGFDTTTADHMSVHLNGDHREYNPAYPPVNLPNIEDSAYHALEVTWHYDAATPANSTITGKITVGADEYVITYPIDPATIFPPGVPIYVGFTSGANSQANNEHRASFGAAGSAGTCSSIVFPVEFVSFDASILDDNSIKLDWTTASEVNNDYFQVMRSVDGNMWEIIGQVDGVGNSDELNSYEAYDFVPVEGIVYYQLKQVDFNGTYAFSEVLEVEIGFDEALHVNPFPNPIQDQLNLVISSQLINVPMRLQVFDGTGKVIKEEFLPASEAFSRQVALDMSDAAPGLYLVKVNNGKRSTTQPVIVSR